MFVVRLLIVTLYIVFDVTIHIDCVYIASYTMALPTPSTILDALESAGDHHLVVDVKDQFAEKVEPFLDTSPSDADGRVFLAHRTIVALFESLPHKFALELIEPWYIDRLDEIRGVSLPQSWRITENESAVTALRNVLSDVMHSLSPIIMVSAVTSAFCEPDVTERDVDHIRYLNYRGNDDLTRALAEDLEAIFALAFTPSKFPEFIQDFHSMIWCRDPEEVRRWVHEIFDVAQDSSGYVAQSELETFDEEFQCDFVYSHEYPSELTVHLIMRDLEQSLCKCFEDKTDVLIRDIAHHLWKGQTSPELSEQLNTVPSTMFLTKLLDTLPSGLAKAVVTRGRFLVTEWPNYAYCADDICAVGLLVTDRDASDVLHDLLLDIDPNVVAGWVRQPIVDEMPSVETQNFALS